MQRANARSPEVNCLAVVYLVGTTVILSRRTVLLRIGREAREAVITDFHSQYSVKVEHYTPPDTDLTA